MNKYLNYISIYMLVLITLVKWEMLFNFNELGWLFYN